MPDTKFSLRGLCEHLRKYWWVYLVGVALCALASELLWTVTEPRPTNEQTVAVYLVDSYTNPDALSDVAADMLSETKPFDGNLKEVRFESMLFDDNEYTSRMLMMTRLSVGECDAFLACQQGAETLAGYEALMPLDELVAEGWLSEYGLEPWYYTRADEETGESATYLAGLRLDDVDALVQRGAFNNEGALLCVAVNGGNAQTTLRALETMMKDLTEATDAATKAE